MHADPALAPLGGLDAGARGQVGQALERLHEAGAAVGVAGVVDGVDADAQVARAQALGHGQRVRQEDGVARRHVGHGNVVRVLHVAALRHRDVRRQRAGAEDAQVDGGHAVRRSAERLRHFRRAFELHAVALAVVEAQRVAVEALVPKMRQHHGGIHAAREKDHGGGTGCGRAHDGLGTCSSTCCRMRRVVSVSPWCM